MDTDLSDKELILSVLQGEQQSFSLLVRRYQNLIFSIILKRVREQHVAEELAQDVFIRAYKSLKTFRFESEFSTWLVRIALNTAYNYRQSRIFKQQRNNSDLADHELASAAPRPDELLAAQQLRKIFEDCFQKLSEKLSQALLLSGLQGLSYEVAAEVMQIPVGTVRSRINQARLLVLECMQSKS